MAFEFQFDDARKCPIGLAKEQPHQTLDQQRGKEINTSSGRVTTSTLGSPDPNAGLDPRTATIDA